MRLVNKHALITAAGQGIGRATAIASAREDAEVPATDLNPAALASLCRPKAFGASKPMPRVVTRHDCRLQRGHHQHVLGSLTP